MVRQKEAGQLKERRAKWTMKVTRERERERERKREEESQVVRSTSLVYGESHDRLVREITIKKEKKRRQRCIFVVLVSALSPDWRKREKKSNIFQ